ncbi:CAP-associated domain-containing protein [Bacillus sp. B190/17]|uniref:CAP-associated domain-containing protein n=1 Tax=Bacillus lumedeiriae TaxID=3058829 RepID=A0ABW8I5X3_9BACI
MRSVIRILVVMSIILIAGIYFNQAKEEQEVLHNSAALNPAKSDMNVEQELAETNKSLPVVEQLTSGAGMYIGKEAPLLRKAKGEPARKDPSAYGYEWWIYKDVDQYVQFGVENNKVVTAYAAGEADVSPFKIGQPVKDIFQTYDLRMDVVITNEEGTYRLELSEEDFNIRPIVRLGDIYAQLYIDKFTGTLSSVRYLTKDYLIKQRPYEMVYRGELPVDPELTDPAWRAIEEGSEKQILDLTNIIREKHHLKQVTWEEKTAEVAKNHSKEMYEKQYFAHESPSAGDLGNRLKAANIAYQLAGENIAANYTDGPAAIEGWLNSKNHREALLEKDFTFLGVGVYRKYYTQNFIAK